MSFRTAIYYVDLVVRTGLTLEHAISQAREVDANRKASVFDQDALDEAARRGFSNGAFEELVEDVPAVVLEVYPEDEAEHATVRAVKGQRGKLAAKGACVPCDIGMPCERDPPAQTEPGTPTDH